MPRPCSMSMTKKKESIKQKEEQRRSTLPRWREEP